MTDLIPEKPGLIMSCLMSATFSDAEEQWLFAASNAASSDTAWADYSYWPDRYGLGGSVEAAVALAFAYQPFILSHDPPT